MCYCILFAESIDSVDPQTSVFNESVDTDVVIAAVLFNTDDVSVQRSYLAARENVFNE